MPYFVEPLNRAIVRRIDCSTRLVLFVVKEPTHVSSGRNLQEL